MGLDVHPIDKDKNDETLYMTKSVRATSDISIKTPIMAYSNGLINSNEKVASGTRGLNEIYCEINTNKIPLKKLVTDTKFSDSLVSRIRAQQPKSQNMSGNEIDICILECDLERYPKDDGWDFLLNTVHGYSHIVPLPNIPFITNQINSEAKFKKYLAFVEKSIKYLRDYNGKPIMGGIPKLPYEYTKRLVLFYLENDINALYFDFAARNPTILIPDLLEIFKILVQNKKIDQTFMYAYNVSAGRLSKTKEAVSAKNILAFGFGFDAMGRKHKRSSFVPLPPPQGLGGEANTDEKKIRLFNRSDYGYYRVVGSQRIREIYPTDEPCIEIETFMKATSSKSKLTRCEALMNNEQLAREALNLQGVIKHDPPSQYLSQKKYVKRSYISALKNHKTEVCQKRLSG